MLKRSQSQFTVNARQVAKPISIGGSRPIVQATAEKASALANVPNVPLLAARIYSPPAMQLYDDNDPRFEAKANNVENIYHPAEQVIEQPRAGIMQILNWLFKGEMR
jgi:hypothetical protein